MDVRIKRIYEKIEECDGLRILVDRLWPRGLIREKTKMDMWRKEIAPSDALRKWFGHREEHWEEFKKQYWGELKNKKHLLKDLKNLSRNSNVTLLYAAKDKERNNAVVLLGFLKKQ